MSAPTPRSGFTTSRSAATVAEEKRLRKRIQNRLNKRTSRSRKLKFENNACNANQPSKHYQSQTGRWRLDEHQVFQSFHTLSNTRSIKKIAAVDADAHTGTELAETTTRFPLSPDHLLLHLVKYNVFRGLWENKLILDCLTMQCQIKTKEPTECLSRHASSLLPSVSLPVAPHYSAHALTPTLSQMTVIHSSWINFLPFPRMREDLIKWELDFDHSDLVRDLVGDLIDSKHFLTFPDPAQRSTTLQCKQMRTVLLGEDNDEPPAITEAGLIVWGEPDRTENWEATPEFLRKWGWAMRGSQDLIDATNYWRSKRGEGPLQLVFLNDIGTP